MLSSKAIGWMLPAGILGFVVMFITQFMQGDQGGTAGTVVWAASSNDWQTICLLYTSPSPRARG